MVWRIQSGVSDLFEHISGLNTECHIPYHTK